MGDSPFAGIEKIQVPLGDPTYEWKYDKMVMEKSGLWTLQVKLCGFNEVIKPKYKLGFVLDPSTYNTSIKSTMRKYFDAQSELPIDGKDTYVNKVMKVHAEYMQDSDRFGVNEFEVFTCDTKSKGLDKVMKFVIDSDTADFFRSRFEDLSRSVLVLND